jgi:mRNA interferase MazF
VPWAPDRGDVVWISMDPSRGHDKSGRRPAAVLSPVAYNERVGLALMCPITSRVKGYPFEVPLPEGAGVEGVILSDLMKSLDWRARGAELAGRLPDETITAVVQRVSTLLTGRAIGSRTVQELRGFLPGMDTEVEREED